MSDPHHSRSIEEDDLLARSTKKIKATSSTATGNDQMDDLGGRVGKPTFRDMVTGKKGVNAFGESDAFGPLDQNEGLLMISAKDSWPCLETTERLRERLNRRWRDSLVVKLLRRNISLMVLEGKLQRLWAPKAEFELIDIGDGYYAIRFTSLEDRKFVLEEGPWIIFGHYLKVREWCPEFRPEEDHIESTAAWVWFPGLPLKYYDERVLLAMGNMLGKAFKVDHNTQYASRGKFARVCVEVNLHKPLVPKICLDGR